MTYDTWKLQEQVYFEAAMQTLLEPVMSLEHMDSSQQAQEHTD